jgi:hypothetical protein
MAIVVSRRVALLKAIHLSPVWQSQRLRPAPVYHSDPSIREAGMERIPIWARFVESGDIS